MGRENPPPTGLEQAGFSQLTHCARPTAYRSGRLAGVVEEGIEIDPIHLTTAVAILH